MPIAGVLILTNIEEAQEVLVNLNTVENVTTYGIHKQNYIIAVLEGDTPKSLEILSQSITNGISGVIGVYPTYVNYEDDEAEG
ncbi:MAG: chaperone NapD [Candidatus Marinimicrobia bacterium]|nr:chaperone NapD [Candidatus Neomarinimicrobiota bacterium]